MIQSDADIRFKQLWKDLRKAEKILLNTNRTITEKLEASSTLCNFWNLVSHEEELKVRLFNRLGLTPVKIKEKQSAVFPGQDIPLMPDRYVAKQLKMAEDLHAGYSEWVSL